MRSSPAPHPAIILGCAALAAELPALTAFLLVRWGPHFGPGWANWPLLVGVFPVYHATFKLHLLPRDLGMLQVQVAFGLFTILFILTVFFASWRSRFWRQILAGGAAASVLLNFLGCLVLIA